MCPQHITNIQVLFQYPLPPPPPSPGEAEVRKKVQLTLEKAPNKDGYITVPSTV